MASTLWTGAISFGLVSVPVKMTSATVKRDISFNQLEADTGSRVRIRRVSEASGEELSPDRIVKGYEITKGRYVVIEPSELDAIRPASTDSIEIEQFVDLAQIDPVYFENPYYLIPDKQGMKAYRLLVSAMEALGKVALGRVVMRQKESLVAIRVREGVLLLEMLRYADELVPLSDLSGVPGDDVKVTDKELTMARQLVEALSDDFDPSRFKNEYREQVLDLIERKAAGEEIVAEPSAQPPAKVLDLMAALEASIAKAGAKGAADKPAKRVAKKPARAKRSA